MSAKATVIDFEDYKRKKYGLDRPIFSEPTTITLSDPNDPDSTSQFTIVCNLVHDNRQFFALEREDKQEKLFTLVEGVTDKGSLVKVVPVAKAEYREVEELFKKVFAQANTKYNYGSLK